MRRIRVTIATFAGLLLLLVALVAAISVGLKLKHSAPLSPAESTLAGAWREVGFDEHDSASMRFGADRVVQTSDEQFTGRWWIEEGRLHIRAWPVAPPGNVLTELRNEYSAETVAYQLRFHHDGDRVTLSAGGDSEFDIELVRMSQ